MAIAVPGELFTFQVLFLDGLGNPITVPATIEVFTFNPAGSKVTLVAAGAAMSPVVGDPGRYIFIYALPAVWNNQPTIYGVMQGVDPSTATNIVVEEQVDVISNKATLTVLNNGVVVSSEVASMNFTGAGVTVASPTPGTIDLTIPQAVGRGLIAQFVKGG